MSNLIIPSSTRSFRNACLSLRGFLGRYGIRSVLIGVSGGADSMLTLCLFSSVARDWPELRLRLYAAHANFHLRGEESDRDEKFVRSQARDMPEVTFFFEDFDTTAYAAAKGVSIEMAARELRHDWWRRLMESHQIDCVATGHNANDNEETLLLNMLRGASPAGLKGMAPYERHILRPLLGLYRDTILSLLKECGGSHITDSSNLTSDYRRNFLRHEILPRLESRWEGIHTALRTTMELQREAAAIVEASVEEVLKEEERINPGKLRWSILQTYPSPLTLIYHFGRKAGLSTAVAREIASHIPSADEESCSTPGRIWKLSTGDELLTTPMALELRRPGNKGYLTDFPSELKAEHLDYDPEIFGVLNIPSPLMEHVRTATLQEVYLPRPLEHYRWRRVRQGDKIRLFPGMRHQSKLVSDVLKENKVLMADRPHIVALADLTTDEIVWIPGIRRAGIDLIAPDAHEAWHVKL